MNTTFILCPPLIVMSTSMQTFWLFMEESPAFTPLPTLGQPYTITCINDAVLHNTMHSLLMQHHVGHIHLVHCPTYGELPFIQLDSAKMISKGEEHSIDTNTPQFWKTMLVLSGYFDCYANREEKDDPLWNVSLFHDSFESLIGKRALKHGLGRLFRGSKCWKM